MSSHDLSKSCLMFHSSEPQPNPSELASLSPDSLGRKKLLQVLFVHHDMEAVGRCLRELNKTRFTVSWSVVTSAEEFTDKLRSKSYDVVISEHPLPAWRSRPVRDILDERRKAIPLILVVHKRRSETVANLIMKGAFDCVEASNLGHLPVTVLRALGEKALRDERDRTQKELRRSEARYRALAGNLNYGIFHCRLDGSFIDVNQTLMAILGFETRDDLLRVNFMRDIVQDAGKVAQLLGQTDELDPLEVEWRREDRKPVRVRLSGQRVASDEAETYEVIVEDITKQRALENHLRRLAASDALTGLGNYRHLIQALAMEIKRSKRTGHEFAVLILDVDGLKRINDQYGHVVGNQALCRVADALVICCRDIDSAVRFGGDEFAIVLPETGREAANSVALRVCASIRNDDKGPDLSVSLGVALYPEDGDTVESLMKAADSAMYAIKRKRNQFATSSTAEFP